MSEYYKRVELTEGTPVVFVGVHVLRWQPYWGEPSVGFVECGDEIDALRKQLEIAREALEKYASDYWELNTMEKLSNMIAQDALDKMESVR
jgi:hypothetical protein